MRCQPLWAVYPPWVDCHASACHFFAYALMIMCKVGVSMKRLLYLFNQLLSLCNNALRLALRLLKF